MLRYESYKPSGIQWVEKVPSHWGVERAKWLFNRMERPVRPEDDVVTAFRDGQVTLRTNRRTEGFTNAIQEHGYQGIRKGDLVIHAMDAFAGAIGVSDSDGKSTPVYAACVPRGEYPVNSYYYAYLLRYMAHSGYIESLSKGIRERSTDFRFAEFRELPLPIPEKDEQERIVAFLDQKTAEIDAAIAKKERLIELQQTQKLSLIHDLVTNGLGSTNSLKPSCIKWLNDIPSHWRVIPGFTCYSEIKQKNKKLQEKTVLSLSYGRIIVKPAEKMTGLVPESFDTYQILRPGDIVIRTTDLQNDQTSLRVGFSKNNGIITSAYLGLRCLNDVHPEYLSRVLEVYDFLKVFYSMGSGLRQNIGFSDFKRLPIIAPPIPEQIEIASEINRRIAKFDKLSVLLHEQIGKLSEFKKILVSDVVLGKIRL